MKRGKETCRILKEIRRQIADANDIEFITSECRYQGDCLGTCPKCEAEVQYLEQQLSARHAAGKAIALAGISAGLLFSSATSFASESQPIKQSQSIQNSSSDKVFLAVGEVQSIYDRAYQPIYQEFYDRFSAPSEFHDAINGKLIALITFKKNGRIKNVEITNSNLPKVVDKEVINTLMNFEGIIITKNGVPVEQISLPISLNIPPRLIITTLETDETSDSVTISGNVKTIDNNDDMFAATIIENPDQKPITNMAETDLNGNFTLKVKKGSKVSISFIGYKTITFSVNGNCNIQAYLDNDFYLTGEVIGPTIIEL